MTGPWKAQLVPRPVDIQQLAGELQDGHSQDYKETARTNSLVLRAVVTESHSESDGHDDEGGSPCKGVVEPDNLRQDVQRA